MRQALGPFDVDRFAAPHNATCTTYNALFAAAGVAAVDALAQDWRRGVSYVFAPFPLLDRVLDIVERDDAVAVIVVPNRVWERYWLRLHSGPWQERIEDSLWLDGSALVKHEPNAAYCFVRGDQYHNRLWVVKTRRLGGGDRGQVLGGVDRGQVLAGGNRAFPATAPPAPATPGPRDVASGVNDNPADGTAHPGHWHLMSRAARKHWKKRTGPPQPARL